jgi:hypothetical protein
MPSTHSPKNERIFNDSDGSISASIRPDNFIAQNRDLVQHRPGLNGVQTTNHIRIKHPCEVFRQLGAAEIAKPLNTDEILFKIAILPFAQIESNPCPCVPINR